MEGKTFFLFCWIFYWKYTLTKTNSFPLEMVVFNRNLLFQGSIFKGYFSVREGTSSRRLKLHSVNVNDLKKPKDGTQNVMVTVTKG